MMRFTCLIIGLLCVVSIHAQNAAALQKIIARTNVDKLEELGEQWRVRDSLRKTEALQKAQEKGWPIRIETATMTAELMRLDDKGNPLYYYTGNDDAAISTQTDQLHSGGGSGYNLEGSGMTIGEWDGGAVRGTHEQLSGRVTQVDNPGSNSNHATHVAGTLIGDGSPASSAKGMAPQASLDAYDWNSDNSEMTTAAADGLLISNHSYGFVTGWYGSDNWYGGQYEPEAYGFGIYNGPAIDWDVIAVNAPYYLICKSAGNDRNDGTPPVGTQYYLNGATDTLYTYDPTNHPESSPEQDGGTDGYDCISWMGNAKNILTVGAVHDVTNYTGPSDVSMSSFSGWGPTDDGRIKPDIVGNGVGLYSSVANTNSSYSTYSGTSMSGPNVAGSLLLLQEHYLATHNDNAMLAATLKALVIHTARECGDADGPDYQYGWGLLSAKDAVDLIADDVNTDSTIAELTLQNDSTYTYVFESDGTEPLRATICWTDPAGYTSNDSLNDITPKLINDLDLRIKEGNNTYEPYVLDQTQPGNPATTGDNVLDNVEQVYIASPTAAQYTLEVTHKGTLSSSQDFSLIVSGQNNILLPVEFISIQGQAHPDHNQVECSLYEEDLDSLVLQRWDGLSFINVDVRLSNGLSRLSEYSFKDKDIFKHRHFIYRIQAIDRDGSIDYSRLIHIVRRQGMSSFAVYPNPVHDQLQITGGAEMESMRLMSENGKQLRTWHSPIPRQIDMQLYPSGTYYMLAVRGDEVFSQKIIKK